MSDGYKIGVNSVRIGRLNEDGTVTETDGQLVSPSQFVFPAVEDDRKISFDVSAVMKPIVWKFKLLTLKQWQFFDLMFSRLIWKRKDK